MPEKSKSRQITVAEMAPHVHNFYNGENKVVKITLWLEKWIKESLDSNNIAPYDFLPLKGDLAFHIGVSIGTIQAVYRRLEDFNLVESKQRIGTYIKDNSVKINNLIRHTSKREEICEKIKNFLKENDYKIGDKIPSSRFFANLTGFSVTTIQKSIIYLSDIGFLIKNNNKFLLNSNEFHIKSIQSKTLSEKLAEQIRENIKENFKIGDKILSGTEYAKKYNTSIKTVHDAMKILEKEGIIIIRRGKYGTFVAGQEVTYAYQKIELKIKHYIMTNCEIGDKLPPIKKFAQDCCVSTRTIKTALDNLAEEGYITYTRGRNGGTFVTDLPQGVNETYTWLALNPDYLSNIDEN